MTRAPRTGPGFVDALARASSSARNRSAISNRSRSSVVNRSFSLRDLAIDVVSAGDQPSPFQPLETAGGIFSPAASRRAS